MHLILLAFNTLGIQSLSVVSGGSKSIFSKKENASALLLVASQVILVLGKEFFLKTFIYQASTPRVSHLRNITCVNSTGVG